MLALLLACAAPPPPALTVFAASSLTDALPQVGADWQALGGGPLTFSFDASGRLAKQITAGAPADLFFSADVRWMDSLAEAGRLDPASRVRLLTNTLVVIVPAGAVAPPASLAELADPRIVRLALGEPGVPAGRYAEQALDAAGVRPAAAPVRASDVRDVLAWVARGEADAGIVYASDARAEPRVKVAFAIDPALHEPILYPAAALAGAPRAALDFLAFCQEDAADARFAAAGFGVLP